VHLNCEVIATCQRAHGRDVDVTQAIVGSAASTVVVARHLIWKVPKKLMNMLNCKHLLLTRQGEGLFRHIHVRGFEKLPHGVGRPIRTSMLGQVQWIVSKQCKLETLGLMPAQPFESIAGSTVSLVTDGFFETVAAGRIRVAKGRSTVELKVQSGQRVAVLDDGQVLPANAVICGTGSEQLVPGASEASWPTWRPAGPTAMPRWATTAWASKQRSARPSASTCPCRRTSPSRIGSARPRHARKS
jgi:hypothetical protein